MFDKNVFKENFRVWSNQYPQASLEEVERFCEQHIPAEYKEKYAWLMSESISWFIWKQENLQRDLVHESSEIMFIN